MWFARVIYPLAIPRDVLMATNHDEMNPPVLHAAVIRVALTRRRLSSTHHNSSSDTGITFINARCKPGLSDLLP